MNITNIINIILIISVLILAYEVYTKECYEVKITQDSAGYSCISQYDYELKGFCLLLSNNSQSSEFIIKSD